MLICSSRVLHARRHLDELYSVVGMFINTLPLRLEQFDASAVALSSTAQRVIVEALQHAHVPLYRIVTARGARRATSYSPLFQTMFQVNTVHRHALEQSIHSVDEPTIKLDLEMQLFHCDGEIGGKLIYDAAIYDAATVRRWVGLYKVLLTLAVEEPDTPLQDFAFNDKSVVSAYKYWRQQLREGRLPVLELPLDFARPAAQIFDRCTVPVVFSAETVRQLNALSLEYGSTLFNVLLALWVLLLCRHSAQYEVVVGVPADKMTRLSDSPIALLLALPHGSSFATLVSMATEAVFRASAHAHIPLQAVIEELYPHNAHDTSQHPIFQTAFALHDLRRWESFAACDISFIGSVVESGGLDGAVNFRSDLFEHSSIQRLAARLQVLAAALVADPAAADVWALPLMALDEAEHVLWTFNDTVTALPIIECIHDLVVAQTEVTSQAVALDWHGSKMTYAELMECAAKVAGWLHSNGVAPDCVVALQLHRSLEQVVSMLGTLLAGGAYLPLDCSWPSERRRFMIQDAECKQLIAQPIYLSDFLWFGGAVLPLDNAWSLSETHACWPVQSSRPENLAYVMYTSGSTGKPKGVMVPHTGVVNLLLGARLRYQCSTDCIFGVPTPYVFDVSVYNIFTSLVVHCGTCQLLQDGSSLATLTANDKLTRVAAVPSILAIARLPPSTNHVEVGGEALTQRAVDNVPTHTHIYNYYGYAHRPPPLIT